jgi:hypothetical protein
MKGFLITADHDSQKVDAQAIDVRQNDADHSVDRAHMRELLLLDDPDFLTAIYPSGPFFGGHCAYLNDSGLSKKHLGHIFCRRLYAMPLAGPVLILGDCYGQATDAWLDLAMLSEFVHSSYVAHQAARARHAQFERAFMNLNDLHTSKQM